MAEHTVIHNTFVIPRFYPKPPERVFAAFSDPAKKRRWYAESNSHEVTNFELEFVPGGVERAAYRMGAMTPFPGALLESDGRHLDVVPHARIVIASAMSLDGRRFSASLCTFAFAATATGTDLVFTHQGAFFEGADGPQMREGGWQALLDRLGEELAR
ncbi:MAG TPA: SRPBCC family protein [Rhizomicrobium sp.]|jgi:uncharacterized protein YndB with AHSA1/START domain|nr:SRPBCC family protein [Rhizomicrobium sp.]